MVVEADFLESNFEEAVTKESDIFNILFPIFLSVGTLWYLKILWDRKRLFYYSWNVPGPMAFPIIGSAHFFVLMLLNLSDIFGVIKNLANAYPGGIYRAWLGPQLIYVITKPEYLEILLTNPNSLEKANQYRFMKEMFQLGLLTAPSTTLQRIGSYFGKDRFESPTFGSVVQIWKRSRKIISPAFNQKALDQFVEIFVKYSNVLSEVMKKHCGKKGDEIDLFHMMSRCTLDAICDTAMGTKINAQTTNCKFSMWTDRAMEITSHRIFNVLHHNDTIFGLSSAGKELTKTVKNINDFTLKVVKEKRALYRNRKKHIEDNYENNFYEDQDMRKKALVDYLMELSENEEKPFTDEELTGEVNTFIIAGSDTSTTTMCFALTALGIYQDVQGYMNWWIDYREVGVQRKTHCRGIVNKLIVKKQKAYEEILDVLGPDKPVEYGDLASLKYLERVIKETLRIFSALSYVGRRTTADIDLGDYVIPKDSEMMLIFSQVHFDSKYWPDPHKFDPDRFLPEEVAKRPRCVYMPFLYGPRNCIGMKYAMMSMKTILATIVRKYKFFTDYKSTEEIVLKSNLVLRAKDGYKVTFEPRE